MSDFAATMAAKTVATEAWARTHCPRHFVTGMWLSSLGTVFVEALRSKHTSHFELQVSSITLDMKDRLVDWNALSAGEASRKRYDYCKDVLDAFTMIEADASKAYWAAGWRPSR